MQQGQLGSIHAVQVTLRPCCSYTSQEIHTFNSARNTVSSVLEDGGFFLLSLLLLRPEETKISV